MRSRVARKTGSSIWKTCNERASAGISLPADGLQRLPITSYSITISRLIIQRHRRSVVIFLGIAIVQRLANLTRIDLVAFFHLVYKAVDLGTLPIAPSDVAPILKVPLNTFETGR